MERAMSIGMLVLVALLTGVFAGRVALRVWTPGDPRVQNAGLLDLSSASDEFVGPCLVEFVVDGDTVTVSCGGGATRVDLVGSDAPEAGERGFAEAGHALRELTSSGEVWLALESPRALPAGTNGTNGDHAVAWVYAGDGRELNTEMVRMGFSTYELRQVPTHTPSRLAEAEIEARVHRRGLWAP